MDPVRLGYLCYIFGGLDPLCLYSAVLLPWIVCTGCMGSKEGAWAVGFILGRWVEAVGMCLREGDNVATRNPPSSAENRHSSISLQQSGGLCLGRVIHSQYQLQYLFTATIATRRALLPNVKDDRT